MTARQQVSGRIWTADFILTCAANFILFIAFYLLLPTLPQYVEGLGGDEAAVGLLMGVFTLAAMALRPWIGLALDRLGRTPVYLAGLATFVALVYLYRWAASIPLLLLLRIPHGVGWGMATTAQSTIAADLAPPARRGEALGYFGMFTTLAMAFGPSLGMAVILRYSFPVLFTVSAALAAIALAIASRIHEPPREGKGGRGPLFNTSALLPSLVVLFVTMTYGAVVTFVPLYARDLGMANPGLFFTVMGVVLLVSRPLSGRISDLLGRGAAILPGLALIAVTLLVLASDGGQTMIVLAAVFAGLGYGATQPALMALAVELAGAGRRGSAMATYTLFFDLGIALGSIIFGVIARQAGYPGMFLSAVTVAATGAAVFLGGMRRARQSRPVPSTATAPANNGHAAGRE